MFKTLGYLTSTISVLLLAIVSWDSAKTDDLLRNCLIVGAAASVLGMFFRWLSFRLDEKPHSDRAADVRHARVDPRG